MNKKAIRLSTVDKIFIASITVVLTAFLIIILYPLIYVISASVSGAAQGPHLYLWPRNFTLASYKAVFEYEEIWTGYGNSLIYMVCSTVASLFVTICCAYPLSVPDFKGAKLLMPMCIVTMYFSGGLIPTYLVMSKLGMVNNRLSVILPGALSVYNMIVMRTYFRSQIPNELRESASLDGCGNIRYLISVVLPLSGAVISVIALFCAVGSWNSYFTPMIYLKKREMYPLTLFIREILVQNDTSRMEMAVDLAADIELEQRRNLMKYAVIVVSSLPVMAIYPFVQRYFVKGVMIGAVKG